MPNNIPQVSLQAIRLQTTQDFETSILCVTDEGGHQIDLLMPTPTLIELMFQALQMLQARGQAHGPLPNHQYEIASGPVLVPTNVAITRNRDGTLPTATALVFRFAPDVSIGFAVDDATLKAVVQPRNSNGS